MDFRKVFLLIISFGLSTYVAKASMLDLFGNPNALFCPDSLKPDASLDDRLFEAYSRVIDGYRGAVPAEHFQRILEGLLHDRDYYSLPKGETGTRAFAELAEKFREAVRRNDFPGGQKLDPEAFDVRLRKYLESLSEKSRISIKGVENAVKETARARAGMQVLKEHTHWVNASRFSPDMKQALTVSEDMRLVLWDLETGKPIRVMTAPGEEGLLQVVVNRDFTQAVTGSMDGRMTHWDLRTGAILHDLKGHKEWIYDLKVNSEFTKAISASQDNMLIVWDLQTGKVIHRLKGHLRTPEAVEVNADFTRAISASQDHTLHVWNLKNGKSIHKLEGHTDQIHSVQVSADFKFAVSASQDGTVLLWDLDAGEVLRRMVREPVERFLNPADIVRADSGLNQALVGYRDGTVILWNLKTGKKIRTFKGHKSNISAMKISTDFKKAVTIGTDGEIFLWDIESGKPLYSYKNPHGPVQALDVDPTFNHAITAGDEGRVLLFDFHILNQKSE